MRNAAPTWLNCRLCAGDMFHVVDLFRKKYMAGAQLQRRHFKSFYYRILRGEETTKILELKKIAFSQIYRN
jgi:hypothetical protein